MTTSTSISVIIPAFNASRFLRDTVGSVRRQSIGPVELIVIDDGSTDDTRDVLQHLDATTVSLTNGGAGRARRMGLEHSTGAYVSFLDADDRLRPDALRHLLQTADATGAPIVSGQLVNIVDAEFTNATPTMSAAYPGPLSSGTLLQRNVFDSVGAFTDDNMSWLRWIAAAKRLTVPMETIDTVVVDRRVHDANMSRTAFIDGGYFSVLREHLRHLSVGGRVAGRDSIDADLS